MHGKSQRERRRTRTPHTTHMHTLSNQQSTNIPPTYPCFSARTCRGDRNRVPSACAEEQKHGNELVSARDTEPEVIGWMKHVSTQRTEGERGEIKSSRERARASQSDRGRDTWCAISNQNIHRDRKCMEQDLKCTRANREDQITDRKNLQKPSKNRMTRTAFKNTRGKR